MKKDSWKTLIIVVLVLIVVIGGTFFISELSIDSTNSPKQLGYDNASFVEEEIAESEQAELTTIAFADYLNLKAGSDLSIIYLARPTCGYCQQQEPIMKNLVYLYQLPVNYLNTDELSEDEFNGLIESDEYFSSGFGTPLILLVKDNQIVDKAEGYHTKDELITFFTDNGFILE